MKANILFVLPALLALGSCSEKKPTQALAPVRVKTMVVGSVATGPSQTYSGTVEEENGSALSFAAAGTVKSIQVSEGQFVRQGQLVGVLDATSARNAHAAAVAAREQALDAQRRMKMLHEAGSLPEIKWVEVQTQLKRAQSAEQIAAKSLTDTKLYAPFSGYITEKDVEAGANVGPGIPVVKLVRIDRIKVKISVPEEEIARFSQGMEVDIHVAALGTKAYKGRVVEKNVSADALSRSYEVKALVPNADHKLLPGMIADVSVHPTTAASPQTATIALPAGIVQLDADNRTFVWTAQNGKAQKTYVETGSNVGQNVIIAHGLSAGSKVIVEGQQKVSSGMDVTEK